MIYNVSYCYNVSLILFELIIFYSIFIYHLFVHSYCYKVLSFTPDNKLYSITVNSTLTLNCTYEGNPSPNVLWYHNGSELVDIKNDPNLSETINGSYSLLEVTFTNINISGEYICEVNNSIGMDNMERSMCMYMHYIFL